MRYREFFRIAIEHQYFSPGEPVELVIVPDQSTHRFLKGQQFIIKDMINGIRILVPIDEGGSAVPGLQADDMFTFKIFPTSGTFHAFTDTPDLTEGEILSFTNVGLSENNTQLTSSVADGSGILCGFPLVAEVTIQVGNLLLDNNNVPTTPEYNIVFNSKAVTWKYYIVSNPETTDLSIQDTNQDINEQLTFSSVELQNNTEDKIMASLNSNFPDANLFLFESEAPVTLRSQPIKGLQLLRHDVDSTTDIIINHLPNPDIKDIDFKIIKVYE